MATPPRGEDRGWQLGSSSPVPGPQHAFTHPPGHTCQPHSEDTGSRGRAVCLPAGKTLDHTVTSSLCCSRVRPRPATFLAMLCHYSVMPRDPVVLPPPLHSAAQQQTRGGLLKTPTQILGIHSWDGWEEAVSIPGHMEKMGKMEQRRKKSQRSELRTVAHRVRCYWHRKYCTG